MSGGSRLAGQRATTDADKVAAGNYSPARHRPVPRYVPRTPKMPRDLPKDAQKIWKRIVPQLAKVKVLTDIDVESLTLYCVRAADLYKTWAKDWKAGDVAQFRLLCVEFGMTPAARLKAPPLVEDEPVPGEVIETCQVPTRNQFASSVIDISKRLSRTPTAAQRGKSMSAASSDSPADDK